MLTPLALGGGLALQIGLVLVPVRAEIGLGRVAFIEVLGAAGAIGNKPNACVNTAPALTIAT